MDNQKKKSFRKLKKRNMCWWAWDRSLTWNFPAKQRRLPQNPGTVTTAECTLALAICGSTVSKAIYAGDGSRDRKGIAEAGKSIGKKSYFVVSSSMNHKLAEVPWKKCY